MTQDTKDEKIRVLERKVISLEKQLSSTVSEEMFRLMIQNSNDSICLIDKNGVQFFINQSVSRITGYEVEELLGPFNDVIHPDDLDVVQDAWLQVSSTNEIVRVQYRHIHKTKGYVWFEAVGQNHLENSAINAVVINVRDISLQKENEEVIKAKNEQLENLNTIKDQLIEAEFEKTLRLTEMLDKRRKELAVNALMLNQLSAFHSKILADLKLMAKQNTEKLEKHLNTLISEVSTSLRLVNWSEFLLRYEELHQDFFKMLGSQFPELSPSEKKLIALIKLGFSSKEISAITHNTIESIHVSRSRLRKKLSISTSENLTLYISQL